MFIEVREKNGIKILLNTDYIRRIGTRVNMQNQTVTQIIMSDGSAITPEETYEEIITLLSTLISRGDIRMEKKFKNGDIVRVTNDKGSLRWVNRYVKVGSKGTVVDVVNQDSILVDFGLKKFYVSSREIELVRRDINE